MTRTASAELDVRAVYEEHASFVWRSLARLGVPEHDLHDAAQEVFLVVHRQRAQFAGQSQLSTWLFGIARRVAAGWRRKAHRRREEPVAEVPVGADEGRTPEESTADAQSRARLARILEALSIDQRAVFVMFEIDGMTCQEIAQTVGCPLGTVYSRLRLARVAFEKRLRQLEAQEPRSTR